MIRKAWRVLWVRLHQAGGKAVQVAGMVRGERGVTLAARTRSLQSRLNGLLAVALAAGVALVMLAWFYGQRLHESGAASRRTETQQLVAVGTGPPALGPISLPRLIRTPSLVRSEEPSTQATSVVEAISPPSSKPLITESPLSRSSSLSGKRASPNRSVTRSGRLRRVLSGGVFATSATSAEARQVRSGSDASEAHARPPVHSDGVPAVPAGYRTEEQGSLQTLLRPERTRATRAQLLPQERLLLAKGTSIDCTLETAIDSTLPGMTTCITSTDTFSADGTVVLLERGTQLIGETRGQVRQGTSRVFVIWTQARTPDGVVVQLDSPATDALGRSGLTGKVNRHFWQRFGAAILVSTLNGVVQSQLQRTSGALVIDRQPEQVLTDSMRGTLGIAPTVDVANGTRVEVLVARDVDFGSVYALVAR